MPKLAFTDNRGIGWHVSYRDLQSGPLTIADASGVAISTESTLGSHFFFTSRELNNEFRFYQYRTRSRLPRRFSAKPREASASRDDAAPAIG